MRRRAAQDRAVSADDGLNTGHSVHRPEKRNEVRGKQIMMRNY